MSYRTKTMLVLITFQIRVQYMMRYKFQALGSLSVIAMLRRNLRELAWTYSPYSSRPSQPCAARAPCCKQFTSPRRFHVREAVCGKRSPSSPMMERTKNSSRVSREAAIAPVNNLNCQRGRANRLERETVGCAPVKRAETPVERD